MTTGRYAEHRHFIDLQLRSVADRLGDEDLKKLLSHAKWLLSGSYMDTETDHAAEPSAPSQSLRVEISYRGLCPFWPAFEDVTFNPKVECFDASSGETVPLPTDLRLKITPCPPPGVVFDQLTGSLAGSPLRERITEAQYMVEASLEGKEHHTACLGWCAFAFTVLPSELAHRLNRTFLTEEPLSSRQPSPVDGCPKSDQARYPATEEPRCPSSASDYPVRPPSVAAPPHARPGSAPVVPRARPMSARTSVRPLGTPLSQRIAGDAPWWYGAQAAAGLREKGRKPPTACACGSLITDPSDMFCFRCGLQQPVAASPQLVWASNGEVRPFASARSTPSKDERPHSAPCHAFSIRQVGPRPRSSLWHGRRLP